ncbi:TRAP transporter large permease subunit, partial [Chloroflexota bacterium]
TEAGAVGAFGAIVITLVARRLKRPVLVTSILETAQLTAMMVLIIAGAFVFNNLIVISKLALMLGDLVTSITLSKYWILTFIIFAYIFLGMFLDVMSAILITVPIFFPIVLALGFDPVWYGVIMVRVMEIGVITPPVGMEVFMLSGITGVPAGTIFRGVFPFVIADILHIALLVSFPALSLFIPQNML